MKMSVEYWWNDVGRKKEKYSEKTCPALLCVSQIIHELTWLSGCPRCEAIDYPPDAWHGLGRLKK